MKRKTRGTEIECQLCDEETCFGCPLLRGDSADENDDEEEEEDV